jgi:hypothetical protein
MVSSDINDFLISTFFLFYIYRAVSKNSNYDKLTWQQRSLFIICSFGLSLTIAYIGLTFEIYGPNGFWCWVDPEYNKTIGLVLYFYVWIMSFLNIAIGYKILNFNYNNNNISEAEKENRNEYARKMIKFPVIILICWIPTTVNRLLPFFEIEDFFFFQELHMIVFYSSGFFFFLTSIKEVNSIFKNFCKCFCCFNNSNDTVFN